MRLRITKCKNTDIFYVIKTVYVNGKQKTKTVERIGNTNEVKQKSNGEDPYVWAKKYVDELNKKEQEGTREILIKKSQTQLIDKDKRNSFNCGYFFLEKIYYGLQLDKICEDITAKYQFKYDLNSILSRLIYGRIIFPSSKLAINELSKKFIEQPNFELQHIYRALEVISKENDFIQSELYKNSLKISKRNTGVLYYDCTNYFFEIEEASGLRQYGPSKEHRPNPITQMGLFMDGDGIPLAFNITAGNTNEQGTLTPLEEKILNDFKLSKFIVCTDAGLASNDNRKFNNKDDRAFITTQSIKKLKKHLKDWALDSKGWSVVGDTKKYDISKLEENEESKKLNYNKTFYKKRWITENGLEQALILTYSLKYKNYQQKIRNAQIERARKAIQNKNIKIDKCNQNDYKRFILKTNVTDDGEVAENKVFAINQKAIAEEEKYDGLYGVCTNLEDNVEEIIKVNHRRWEIEESFRIMKSEFKARPVYLSRDDRIQAHFITCFIALLIHRLLEKKIEEKYTCKEIINCLREMNLMCIGEEGYIPEYTRTDLTDELHEKYGFRTDYEITTEKKIKKILKDLKK